MTLNLSKDLEKIVHDAVKAGLYSREDDVIRDALLRLKQTLPVSPRSKTSRNAAKPSSPAKKTLTPEEFDRHLLATGRMSQLPDTAADYDDPDDVLVDLPGEPLSETVIRERR